MTLNILIIVVTSAVIFYFGERFAGTSTRIGDYFHMPKSVKGATLDAIASSFPELMVAIFAVISFGQFEVGIGTIAGSAIFNLLIIPGICVLVSPVVFKVSSEVMHRDGMFYNIAVFALLAALMYSQMWALLIPIIFILIYIWYIKVTVRHSKEHREGVEQSEATRAVNIWKEAGLGVVYLAVIAFATFYLTEHAIHLAEALGIPAIVVAFTVIAAATSLPDAVISIVNARKGDVDDAAANVFGSNIFDILIGLAIPVLLAYFITGQPVEVVINNIEIIIGLLGATIIMIYFLAEKHTLTKGNAWTLLAFYTIFLAYVIYLGLTGAPA